MRPCPAGAVGPKALGARASPNRFAAGTRPIPVRPGGPMIFDLVKAAFLGIVEGLTEYVPVSSTGHLLLLQHFFGFGDEDFGNTFAVLIQLLAIAIGMFSDPNARRFVLGVLVAFLPAGIIGALAHGFIKSVLFNPWIVCF